MTLTGATMAEEVILNGVSGFFEKLKLSNVKLGLYTEVLTGDRGSSHSGVS